MTALSSTVLSGYVNSSVQIVNAPPSAYKTWLIHKRQDALLAFNRERMLTHNFLGNPAYLQLALKKHHLVFFFSGSGISNQVIPQPSGNMSYLPLVTIANISDNAGYAYFDGPGGMAGPYGTYLFPDNTVWRLTRPPGIGVGRGNGPAQPHPHPTPAPPTVAPSPGSSGNYSSNSVPVR
ncbi:MAG: hypothetical protein JWQ71_581 [Pedosphaera sp.]|nr:hypothetical protein [Pedosphaera sp.]